MAAKFWTCQRSAKGKKCGTKNPSRKRICSECGKVRPARKKPEHSRILRESPYEEWAAKFGHDCNICGRKAYKRRHHRDHDHKTGLARGILCMRCNRALPNWMDAEWLDKAAAYLRRLQ